MSLHISNYSCDILKDISFTLNSGENIVILGSNGVGKTTLAKVLCGITPSSSVIVDSLNLSKIKGEKRAKLVNYIPPKLSIFDEFITLRDFLELSILSKELSIDEIMNMLEISHLQHKSCHSLSSGESQLLLMASALLHSANYTIYDEPTANLDPQKIQLLFTILKDRSLQKSKIIISHNLDLAYKLGFNILFLEDGRVKFYGKNKDFFQQTNLNRVYAGSVKNLKDNIVVDLWEK